MKKVIIALMLLAVATTARAFSFSATAPTGQTLYFTITGSNTVKVVLPGDGNWDGYATPTGTLEIPATVPYDGTTYRVTAIDQRAFRGCNGLTHVIVPHMVRSIGTLAFFLCSSLDTIELPTTLDSIASQAFNNCGLYNNLANWDDSMMLYIGDYLISTRSSMAEGAVEVREGTLGIAGMGLYYCHSIAHLTLPATLRFIGPMAFKECAALDTVRLLGSVPPALASDAFDGVPHAVVAVPCGAANAYRSASGWSALTIVEDTCSSSDTNGIAAATQRPLVQPLPGGIRIDCPAGTHVTVADMMGRTIVQTAAPADGLIVALPSRGVYVVSAEGMLPRKVLYLK